MTDTLHPELASHGDFSHLRLGRGPRRDDPRTLRLARYLDDAVVLPAIPDKVDYTGAVASWPMFGNDRLGDCTIASAAHMVQAWSAVAGGVAKTFDDADVEAAYWETGDPPAATGTAEGPTDTGRVELDVLNYWRKTGLGQPSYADRIVAYVAIDPKNLDQVRAAIFLFGGVYAGISLPQTAQGQQVWDVAGDASQPGPASPGSWGGHAVPLLGYGDGRFKCVTWGATLEMTDAFWETYGDEAYALVSSDWIAATGTSVTGLDLEQLGRDLEAVTEPRTKEEETARAAARDHGGGTNGATGDADGGPSGPPPGTPPDPEIRQTAPVLPWAFVFNASKMWAQKLPGGGMRLVITPAVSTPQGLMPMPPAIELTYAAEEWAALKRYIAADGDATILERTPPSIIIPQQRL